MNPVLPPRSLWQTRGPTGSMHQGSHGSAGFVGAQGRSGGFLFGLGAFGGL
jgi:hypothetical protein